MENIQLIINRSLDLLLSNETGLDFLEKYFTIISEEESTSKKNSIIYCLKPKTQSSFFEFNDFINNNYKSANLTKLGYCEICNDSFECEQYGLSSKLEYKLEKVNSN